MFSSSSESVTTRPTDTHKLTRSHSPLQKPFHKPSRLAPPVAAVVVAVAAVVVAVAHAVLHGPVGVCCTVARGVLLLLLLLWLLSREYSKVVGDAHNNNDAEHQGQGRDRYSTSQLGTERQTSRVDAHTSRHHHLGCCCTGAQHEFQDFCWLIIEVGADFILCSLDDVRIFSDSRIQTVRQF